MIYSKATQGVAFAGVESDSIVCGKCPKIGVTVAYMAMRGVLCGRVLVRVQGYRRAWFAMFNKRLVRHLTIDA